jgi:hypothetical protein
MANEIEELLTEYDELVNDVAGSKHQFFQGNLKRWLDFLDRASPFVGPILQQLESAVDFTIWFAPYRTVAMGGGSKNIEWPEERRKRLGIQLLRFQRMASGDVEAGFFALTLLQSGRNVNDGVSDIIGQIFIPMSRELRRYLKEAADHQDSTPLYVPASDRVVTLNHNSEIYIKTLEGLGQLEEAVQQANDYPDLEDKEQKLAELAAGQRLLRSIRVRIAAVVTVLSAPLMWLIEKFAGGLIGQVAAAAWQGLKTLLGL